MELRSWRTWLRPGMLIKRWIILIMASVVIISLGLAMGLTWAYRNYYSSLAETSEFVRLITLQFIGHPYRELLLIAFGLVIMGRRSVAPQPSRAWPADVADDCQATFGPDCGRTSLWTDATGAQCRGHWRRNRALESSAWSQT